MGQGFSPNSLFPKQLTVGVLTLIEKERAACCQITGPAGSPGCAFTCLPIRAFTCLPLLPDHRAARLPVCAFTCLPVHSLPPQIAGPHACQCAHGLVSQYVPSFVAQRCQIAGPHARQCAHLLVFQYVASFVPQCCHIAGPHARQCAHLLVSQYVPSCASSAPVCAFTCLAARAFSSMCLHLYPSAAR